MTTQRFIQDLNSVQNRGKGLFKASLWRTFDLLKRKGYSGLNFEVHLPVYLTRKRVLVAARTFRDFISNDRFFGVLAKTTVLNHAMKTEGFSPISLKDEGLYAGFHRESAAYDAIVDKCSDKMFLNFDDDAFSEDMRRFLSERFPDRCRFEQVETMLSDPNEEAVLTAESSS